MSDDQNESQPSGREPALSEESVPRTGNEPALSFDLLLPGLRDGLTAADREARLRALQAAFDRPEKSIHLLRVLLDAEYDPRTRQRAASALGQIGDAQSVPALLKITDDPNPNVRRVAVWALGQIGSEDAYPGLIDRFEIETEPGIQYLLIEALNGCTDVRLVSLLIQFRAAYEEGHKSHRLSSDLLRYIAEHGEHARLTTLLEHNNRDVQHWAAEAVAERCPPTVDNIPLLLQCASLDAADPAFQTIARINDESIWDIFNQYLHDDRRAMCRAVLRALGSIGNERSEAMIIEFLRVNKREELAKEAIDILQSDGSLDQRSFSSELVTILIDLYKTADVFFRFSLIDYLGQINDERAFSHLWEVCLKADCLPMRIRALLHLCARNTLTPFMVLELLNDNEHSIRHHAAWCLQSMIVTRAITPHDRQVLMEGVRSHLAQESEADIRLIYILILL